MALADTADRWVTAHHAQRFHAVRQQQRARTGAGRSQRRFGTGMAATDNNYIKTFRKFHQPTTLSDTLTLRQIKTMAKIRRRFSES
jgi:hypothetical protein